MNLRLRFSKIKLPNLFFLIVLFVFFVPAISLADGHNITCDPSDGKLCNPIGVDSINGLVKTLLEGVLKIGMPIIALAIIYSGFLFVAARGNSEKLTKAKDALLYTLIGAAILLGSWAIAELLSNTVMELAFVL
jgi:hypothetical protein